MDSNKKERVAANESFMKEFPELERTIGKSNLSKCLSIGVGWAPMVWCLFDRESMEGWDGISTAMLLGFFFALGWGLRGNLESRLFDIEMEKSRMRKVWRRSELSARQIRPRELDPGGFFAGFLNYRAMRKEFSMSNSTDYPEL